MFSLSLLGFVILVSFHDLHVVAQDVSIDSVNLRGFEGCNDINKIIDGWEDAVNMAKSIKDSININEAAYLEYLGPPNKLKAFDFNIKNMFSKASTFGQGSIGEPTLFKWDVYVRCDDYLKRCSPNTGAYTTNKKKNEPNGPDAIGDDLKTSTPVINFCPSYFQLTTLAKKIESYGNAKGDSKYDVRNYYYNTATVILHEMMHAAIVTYEANSQRRVHDLAYKVRGSNQRQDIYGAARIKILARSGLGLVGKYSVQNADSLAVYALAKYIQQRTTLYPYLPVIEKEDLTEVVRRDGQQLLIWDEAAIADIETDEFGIVTTDAGIECDIEAADADSTCISPFLDIQESLTWTPDEEYPPEYVAQRQAWVNASKAPPQAEPPSGPSDDPQGQPPTGPSVDTPQADPPTGPTVRAIRGQSWAA